MRSKDPVMQDIKKGKGLRPLHSKRIPDRDEDIIITIDVLLHPNTEALKRRDEFLRDLTGLHIDYKTGEIVADCPGVYLKECEDIND